MSEDVRPQPDYRPDRRRDSGHGAVPRPPADEHDLLGVLLQIRARVARIEEMVAERQRVRGHYTTAEVAEILGRAELTVREWCRLRRVRAEKKKRSGWGKPPAWVVGDDELKCIQKEGLLPP